VTDPEELKQAQADMPTLFGGAKDGKKQKALPAESQ
jgi:hypothetical protein